jgi:CYTH domain-containing protein
MEELELTYLLKYPPEGLKNSPSKELLDIYISPVLRIRKAGNKMELTKKVPIMEGDASRHMETTLSLSDEEYIELSQLPGKRVRKIRYSYEQSGTDFEIDVFQDGLKGLVLVDIEFDSVEKKDAFRIPDFCLVDITQEKFIAGGMLCGKTYTDIEKDLKRFGYQSVFI